MVMPSSHLIFCCPLPLESLCLGLFLTGQSHGREFWTPKQNQSGVFSCEFHFWQLQFYLAWNLPSPSWGNTEMCMFQYRKPPETELIILRNECSLHPLLIGPQIPLWYLSCGYRSLMDKRIFKNESKSLGKHRKFWKLEIRTKEKPGVIGEK